MRAQRGDRGDIVVGWLTKIVLVLVAVGLVAFEAVSIGIAHVRTQDIAAAAAREGSAQYHRTNDIERAYRAASDLAAESDGTIAPEEFVVEDDGTVVVSVHREADSMVLHRFSFTRDWLQVKETARARFVG